MSAVPLLRLLSFVAAAGGGVATGHFLIPHRGPAEDAVTGNEAASPAGAAAEKGSAPPAAHGKVFSGSIADLLRLSREAGSYERAQAKLTIALMETPAAEIQRLTMAFPWKPNTNWMENAAYAVLLMRWAETDSDGAMKWCATLPSGRLYGTRWQLLASIAQRDPDKALFHARAIKNASHRQSALVSIAGIVGATDPRRALAIGRSAQGHQDEYWLQGIFSTWAANDPAEAFSAAMALGNRERSGALYSVLHAWAAADPAAAHAAALAQPEGNLRNQSLQAVLSAWAGVDPKAAHAAASVLPEGRARTQAIGYVIQAWAAKDPRGALSVSLALPKGPARQQAMDNVFNVWAAEDPQAAAAGLNTSGLSRNDKARLTGQIASAWAQSDAPAALAWAKTLPAREGGDNAVANALQAIARTDGPGAVAAWQDLPPRQKMNQVQNIVGSWVSRDREAATQWARSLEKPQERTAALGACLWGLDFTETEKITALLSELPAGPARVNGIRNIVGNQADNDPEGTLRWLQTLPENDRTGALKDNNLWELSSGDPQQMAALLRDTPALGAQNYLWGNIASQLASEDPVAALAWVDTLETPGARRQSTDQVMRTWAYENAPAALARAQTFTDPAQQKSAMRAVLETWATSDPDAVLAWAATAGGEEREIALLHGSLQKADHDPAASAGIVSQLLSQNAGEDTPSHLANAAGNVAQAWFQQDVTQAAQWAAQLPAGDAQASAVNMIAQAWAGLDPMAASEWVQQLPPGDSRDKAAQTLSQGIQQSDPESAFTWAASIGDASKRDDAVRSAAQAWRWQDREAARAAVTQAPISEAVRASLLEEMAKQE